MDLNINYKSYKYCLLANSEWLRLYKTKNDYLLVFSEESGKSNSISMDFFNEIVDYWSNSGYDFLYENELLYAIEHNLTREDIEKLQNQPRLF